MRALVLLLFFACSFSAYAGCDEIASYLGKNVFINISDGYCEHETLLSYSAVKSGKVDDSSTRSLKFYEECKFDDSDSSFSCRLNPQSPLSGASYTFLQRGKSTCEDFPDDPGYIYVCSNGCGKGIPRELVPHVDCC